MRLTPVSRHMSTCRLAWATSVDPTLANAPRPPNVIVPIVSTEIRKPEVPSARYSIYPTLPTGDRAGPSRVPPGQLAVDGGVGLHPLPGLPGDLPGDPGRDPHGEHAVGDDHPRRHRRARRDQGAAAYASAVEHRSAVAHQRFRADDGPVDHAQVTDGGALADLGHRVGAAVQHRTVLDVRAAADQDRAEIGAEHGPVPDGGFGLDPDVPDQGGRRRDPRRWADVRLAALKGEQWHPPIMHLAAARPAV